MPARLFGIVSLAITALVMTMPSCGPQRTDGVSPEALVVFPPPPDTARIQFLTRISNSFDVGQKAGGGFMTFLLGGDEGKDGKPIVKPYGIALHGGTIYVCDTMLPGLDVIDLEGHSFEYRRPRGMGQLKKPINCFVDDDTGLLYVADTERGQVVVFDQQGGYVDAIGTAGMKPSDVFVEGNTIWMADMASQQIRTYDKVTRRFRSAVPDSTAPAAGALYQPTNLYVRDDRIYVTDFGDFRIKIFSRTGEFLNAVGSYGLSPGQFVRPKGIAVDRDHNLYVVDAGFENVQVFDRDGKLLMFFGGSYEGLGTMWLPAKVIIDYDNLSYFQRYVSSQFTLKYLILVTNQYGPDKISVYGFVEPRQAPAGSR